MTVQVVYDSERNTKSLKLIYTHNIRGGLVIPEGSFDKHLSRIFPDVEEVRSGNGPHHLIPQLALLNTHRN